jgi:Domain of unknown function (DUF4192)
MTITTGSPASTPARIRAGSPDAHLAVIPHLLGFNPESSFVVIGTAQSGQVKCTLRYDLPDPASAAIAADIADHAIAVLTSQQLHVAVGAGYGPDHLVAPVATALRQAAEHAGMAGPELLRAQDGRYWCYTCTSSSCCSPGGTPFYPPAHAAAVALTQARPSLLPGRDQLAATIAPVTGTAAATAVQALAHAERHIQRMITRTPRAARLGTARKVLHRQGLPAVSRMIETYRSGGSYQTVFRVIWLSVVLRDLRVRDDAWARMDPAHRAAHLRLWTDVTRHARPGHVAPAASLLAFCAWQDGNGALANIALDRALADDPAYSMAQLLRQVITAGAPPSMARLPMTPEEVADCYGDLDQANEDEDAAGRHRQPAAVTA